MYKYIYIYIYIHIRNTYVRIVGLQQVFYFVSHSHIPVRSSRKCRLFSFIHQRSRSLSLSCSLLHVTLVVCVCVSACAVYFTLLSVYFYFFFYIKYRISDDLTKLYPGINVLYAAREGDRSRRKVLRLFVQPISTCNLRDRYFQLSPLSAIRLVIYLDIRLCDDRPTSVSRSSTACPFLRNPFRHNFYNVHSP